MHWIIDRSISGEPGRDRLIAALEKSGTPYSTVRKIPFTDILIAGECLEEAEVQSALQLDISGPVFVTGATSMAGISVQRRWSPGYVNAPGLDECIAQWGKHMLNHDGITGEIGAVQPCDDLFFIRPVNDGKSFPGEVSSRDKLRNGACR
ncbi:MAG: hypothetical protein ACAI35_16655 [Candidatus Methylacidiphilales bacterium]